MCVSFLSSAIWHYMQSLLIGGNITKEVEYMLANDIIEPSKNQWSSPRVLVPKSDGSYRFCTDFCKVNMITKTDSCPIRRVKDCINNIGSALYISKFDLLKGYWQVPLTPWAKEVTAFVTPTGFYQYKVMPFGLKKCTSHLSTDDTPSSCRPGRM